MESPFPCRRRRRPSACLTNEERRREADDAFGATDRTETFGTVALDRSPEHRRPSDSVACISTATWGQFRAFAHHGAVDVRHRPPDHAEMSADHVTQQRQANRRLSISGSVSGKCMPMSPSPAAPEQTHRLQAWEIASASLWPSSPRSPSKRQPAEHEDPGGVVGEAVDVEALGPHGGLRHRSWRVLPDVRAMPGHHVPTRGRSGVGDLACDRSPRSATTTTRPAGGLDQCCVVGGITGTGGVSRS